MTWQWNFMSCAVLISGWTAWVQIWVCWAFAMHDRFKMAATSIFKKQIPRSPIYQNTHRSGSFLGCSACPLLCSVSDRTSKCFDQGLFSFITLNLTLPLIGPFANAHIWPMAIFYLQNRETLKDAVLLAGPLLHQVIWASHEHCRWHLRWRHVF